MVWLLPGAGPPRLWIVIILAYIVGVAGLAHVIADRRVPVRGVQGRGDAERLRGRVPRPSLLGNSIGGVTLVASLDHGQHALTQHAPER